MQISPISETKASPQHREPRALLFANFVFLKYKTVSLKLCLNILVCLSKNSTVAGTCICAKDLLATTTKLERKIKKGNILYNVIPDPGKFPVVDSKLEHTVENNHFFLQKRDIIAVRCQTRESTIHKKMAPVHFTTIACKPNTANRQHKKPYF